jgi:hypothetical protein
MAMRRAMSIVTAKELDELLEHSVVTITFLRKDGRERLIHCTTKVPDHYIPKAKEPKEKKEGVFTVWDMENHGFRRFNFDQVLSVEMGVWKDEKSA